MYARAFVMAGVVLVGGASMCRVGAQVPMGDAKTPQAPPAAKAPGTIPPVRPIFVPIWSDSTTGGKGRASVARRERADVVWTGVPFPAHNLDATVKPEGATATLVELRPSTTPLTAHGRDFIVTIRLKPARPQTAPFLEVVDSASMLQSRGWGRRVRDTAEGTEWQFVLRDPLPPPPGRPNPISARVEAATSPPRSFELRLVSSVPGAPTARNWDQLPLPTPSQ